MKIISFFASLIFITYNFSYCQGIKKSWKINLNAGLNYSKGNINKRDYSSSLEIFHKDTLFEYTTNARFIYSFVDTLLKNKEFSLNQTFDWKPYHRLSPFLALTLYSNQFKGYKIKGGGFFGAKYTFLKRESTNLSLSAAFLYEHETYSTSIIGETKPDMDICRFSVRVKLIQKIGNFTSFSLIGFYKPQFNSFDNYLIDTKAKLIFNINKKFAVDLQYEWNYNSKPPFDRISKSDQLFITSLTLIIDI